MNDDIFKRLKASQTSTTLSETRPQTPAQPRRARRGPWLAVILLGFAGLLSMVTAGSVLAGPALASISEAGWQPDTQQTTPVHSRSFAQVWLPKPTYTPMVVIPSATLPPTELAVDLPDEAASDPVVDSGTTDQIDVQVVEDTPTAEYAESEDNSSASYENAPAANYAGSKYILVDISEQHMYVYENDALVFSFVASTGMNNATATGDFSVLDKIPSAYGSTWDIWMPNWLGIYYAGGLENGIHALPILPNGLTLWAGFLGRPISYGCVVLSSYDAQTLYDWAEVGTPVEIQW